MVVVACGGGEGGGISVASVDPAQLKIAASEAYQKAMQQLESQDDDDADEAREECKKRNNNSFRKLLKCVTLDGVRGHQKKLQDIADANNGIRTSGTPGFDASADYAQKVLRDAGYTVTRQEFQFQSFIQLPGTRLAQVAPAPGGPIDTRLMSYSGSGDVTATVSVLPTVTGCNTVDFAGFTAGHIALISRGACTFAAKATNAQAAGAAGVVIYNNIAGPLNGTLGEGFTLNLVVTAVLQTVGQQLAATPGLVLALKASTIRGTSTTSNIIAESKEGDPNNVVMVGAHLDSVDQGPGLQDNGSGSAAILEVAVQMAKVKPRNKLRFALWGAEESGLVGSTQYVEGLPVAEQEKIALYLNFDMIGSPNPVYFVYDGDNSDAVGAGPGPDGSAAIEKAFEAFYTKRNLPFKGTDFDGRSDYGPFIAAGIPAGGLFTGAEGIKTADEAALWGGTAGTAYDPCYHQACDNFANINLTALDVNADAVAYATLQFAMTTEAVNGIKGKTLKGRIEKRNATPAPKWTQYPQRMND
jgi:Zn-dependent M28 family amino/carboxypeptidase